MTAPGWDPWFGDISAGGDNAQNAFGNYVNRDLILSSTTFVRGQPAMYLGSAEIADAYRRYVETAVEAFGAERCMFESNFPADKSHCGYAQLWNAYKRLAAGCSPQEREALFSGTARRAYSI